MDDYPLIAEHDLIGDLQTAALVATDGTVDCSAARGSTPRVSSARCWTNVAANICEPVLPAKRSPPGSCTCPTPTSSSPGS